MRVYINQLLDVPTSDPDDARRRRLLNIMLLGILIAAMLGLVGLIISSAIQQGAYQAETQYTLFGIILATFGIFGIYQINRRYSGRLAALLFCFF